MWLQRKYCAFLIKPTKNNLMFQLDMTLLPATVKKPNCTSNRLVIHIPSTRWPISLSLSSYVARELPLPDLHPSLTSYMPPTPPPCQLIPEHGLVLLPFDPPPSLWEHAGPEAGGFSISLSQGPVGQVCDRWILVSSSDPPCCSIQFDSVREH